MPSHLTAAYEPAPDSADHDLAAELATAAGRVLLDIRARVGHADGKALKDAGDRGSHEFLTAELAKARPADAVLSEEGKDDPARLEAERVWIVDPLDGTREFSEEGRTDWAVHVALWERGRLVAGAVALPAQGRTLHTAADGGAVVSVASGRTPLTVPEPTPGVLRIAVSRTRPPRFVQRLAERLEAKVELVPIGSAGAKISAVLLGDVDAYVHAGGQYEWDNAAPAAVALAAGAHATRIDGTAPTYNNRDVLLPDILVCHPVSAPMMLAGIRDVSPGLSG
ncbi:3'(2'),5'-bisphosphate nucleotidase CysQ [Thermomonospora catenispora]|uniref:3'(2'),5'-bisphosphate nucleotidase CysQ n=1 Tax=Thermomonospora catenispora TaxID=2493090 RepID=UPI0011218612|nr:3'(2'),5'-bisphosphate nucleotidase CysQ [Thermomonospora catenispora]TNY37228.1 3'(2'),5'-bisphosphate nucleotidase CysQ [Thermomonospora catenispora]